MAYTKIQDEAISTANSLVKLSKEVPHIMNLAEMQDAAQKAITLSTSDFSEGVFRAFLSCLMQNETEQEGKQKIIGTDLAYTAGKVLVTYAKEWGTAPTSSEEWEKALNKLEESYKSSEGLIDSQRKFISSILVGYEFLLEQDSKKIKPAA